MTDTKLYDYTHAFWIVFYILYQLKKYFHKKILSLSNFLITLLIKLKKDIST